MIGLVRIRMKIKNFGWIFLIGFFWIPLLHALSTAQPVRDRVLADVKIVEKTECAVIHIGLNFPVRYLKHFPLASGDELRIRLVPIAISPDDREALFKRESVRPGPSDLAQLSEVVFEGDVAGGPYLTLLFRHPVQYRVSQGSDFRSILVAVSLPESSAPCEPE